MVTREATCFGGPYHRQRVAVEGDRFIVFLHPRSVNLASLEPTDPWPFREKTYTLRKFAGKSMVWDTWVYDGGWVEDETVERHVQLAMQVMWELARHNALIAF